MRVCTLFTLFRLAVPSFQLFAFDKRQRNPLEYSGSPSAPEISDWVLRHASGQAIALLLPHTVRGFLEQVGVKLILFTDKPAPPALFRMLANNQRGKAAFGMVRSAEAAIAAQFHVSTFPTILVIDDAGKTHVYRGAHKYSDIVAFMQPFLKSARAPSPPSAAPQVHVVTDELSPQTLPATCIGDKICVVVVLLSLSDNRAVTTLLKSLANHYHKSPLSFGWVTLSTLKTWAPGNQIAEQFESLPETLGVFLLRLGKHKFLACPKCGDEAAITSLIDKTLLGDSSWDHLH